MMDLIDQTESDLVSNRQGHLSLRQKGKLRRKGLEIVLGNGFLSVAFVVFLIYAVRDVLRGDTIAVIGVIASGIGSIVGIGLTLYKWNQVQQDLASGEVIPTEGKVSLRVMGTRTLRYKLQLGTLELEIPKRAYQKLKEGKRYRVYYAPKSRTILGIEHIH